jgi:hypothetical protein
MADITITVQGDLRIGEYEPGNGTRYTAVAVPFSHEKPMNGMGVVSDGWLVAYGLTGRAHLFQSDGYLADSYLMEKLYVRPGDLPWAGDLIRELIGREN